MLLIVDYKKDMTFQFSWYWYLIIYMAADSFAVLIFTNAYNHAGGSARLYLDTELLWAKC